MEVNMAEKKTKKVADKTEKVVEETTPAETAAPAEETAPKAKKAKKEKPVKAVEPKKPSKPMPTEARAIATNVRITPRKARLVIDLVRGKSVKEALGILHNVNRAASEPVMKVIKSATANATNNFGMDENSLYIDTIYANDGLKMKRYMPRAKGSASGLVKRTCHITVVVKMR